MEKNSQKVNFSDFELDNILSEKPIVTPTPDKETPEPEPKVVEAAAKPKEVEPKKQGKEATPEIDPEEEEIEDDGKEIPEEMPELDLKPFYNAFHQELGWEIPEDEMPENSVKGLVKYMDSLIEQASKPKYADQVSEEFDRFVASGGDPKRFFETMYNQRDYAKIDAEEASDSDKKQVIREHLSTLHPEKDKPWLEKKIARFEDAGVLDDEFTDALSELRYKQDKEKKELVTRQEANRKAQEEARNQQLEQLQQTIYSKKDIAGIPVTKKEMQEFFDYLAIPDDSGKSKYAKALESDPEAVIKMAYVAFKNFDVNNLKTNVKSDVTRDIKKALSRYTSTQAGLHSRAALTPKSGKSSYKDFDLGL